MSSENVVEPTSEVPTTEVPAETPADTSAETPAETKPTETPLSKLTDCLDEIIKTADHGEMWGVELSSDASHIPSQVILQKFLRANSNDVAAAEKQLTSALEWRKLMDPVALMDEAFDGGKFDGLGYITTHKQEDDKEVVITWNIYGAVKDKKATFGNVGEFVKWRAALMELSVKQLNLNDVTELIPEKGDDPYQMLQVHDYQSVSFFRMDSDIRAASKETIQTLSMAYPELLAQKYFVNVPSIMGWMFGAMKFFLAPATIKKFHPMASGTSLSNELKDIAASLPSEYGGQGPSVKEGMTVNLSEVVEEPQTNGAETQKEEEAHEEESESEAPAVQTKEEAAPVLPEFETAASKSANGPPTLDGVGHDTTGQKTDFTMSSGQKDKDACEIEYV